MPIYLDADVQPSRCATSGVGPKDNHKIEVTSSACSMHEVGDVYAGYADKDELIAFCNELLEACVDAIVPAVVFTGNAEFKTTSPDGVFTIDRFLAFVESRTTEVMSANRVQFCVGRLETARRSIMKMTDVEHVEQLRHRYGRDN